jgi:hypothetical protein
MKFVDVVDLLREQHDEIRQRFAGVERSHGADRERRFAELSRAIYRHERGEQAVVHGAAQDATPAGDAIGAARRVEEGVIERSVADLADLGTGAPSFDRRFAELYRMVLAHMTREELDEFPILRRYVQVQRLHWMAGQLRDVQIMDTA